MANSRVINLAMINSEIAGKSLRLSGQFVVELPMPAQDERLPDLLESATLEVGQEFMREIFRLATRAS